MFPRIEKSGPHYFLWNVYFSYALFVDKSFHVYVHFQNKISVSFYYLESYPILYCHLYSSQAGILKTKQYYVFTNIIFHHKTTNVAYPLLGCDSLKYTIVWTVKSLYLPESTIFFLKVILNSFHQFLLYTYTITSIIFYSHV